VAGAAVSPLRESSLVPASPWPAVAGFHGSNPILLRFGGYAARVHVCAWARARHSVAAAGG
jgi:hypothetical protein